MHQTDLPVLEAGLESPSVQPASSAFAETTQALRECGDTLAEIAAALEVGTSRLGQMESVEQVEILGVIPVETFLTWVPQQISSWFTVLDTDLKLTIKLDGLDAESPAPEVVLLAGQQPGEAFAQFVEHVQAVLDAQGNELRVSVRASIRKIRARERVATLLSLRPDHLGTPEMLAQTKPLVFYSSTAWHRLLSPRAIWSWETEGIIADERRLFVVLCDAVGYAGGIALEVLGAEVPDEVRWLSLTRASWRQFLARSQKIRLLHNEESYWDTAPKILTPEYFRVEERSPGLEMTQALLASARAALSAAFMANTVFGNMDQDLTLRFGGGRPCTCILSASSYSATSPLAQQQESVSGLARWAYAQPSADRLLIARESLAGELPPGGQVTLQEVDTAGAGALDAARANLAIYLRQNAKQYFQLRQQAVDAVHAYANSVRKSIADLTADLVSNLFKTGGLFVGILIANLINPASTVGVQRLAAVAYVIYLGFILFYVMPAHWHRYQREAASVDQELGVISELSDDERGKIREIATADDDDFRSYYWRTVIGYAVMCLFGIVFIFATWIGAPASVPPHVVGSPTP